MNAANLKRYYRICQNIYEALKSEIWGNEEAPTAEPGVYEPTVLAWAYTLENGAWRATTSGLIAQTLEEHCGHTVVPLVPQYPGPGLWYRGEDVDRLVRELDVALNGDGAAPQAKLCDIVGQVKNGGWKLVREADKPGWLSEAQ